MWDRFLRLVPGVLRSESGLLDCSFSMELADQFPVMELADDPIILFRGDGRVELKLGMDFKLFLHVPFVFLRVGSKYIGSIEVFS
jgi:hypothetical protein